MLQRKLPQFFGTHFADRQVFKIMAAGIASPLSDHLLSLKGCCMYLDAGAAVHSSIRLEALLGDHFVHKTVMAAPFDALSSLWLSVAFLAAQHWA